VRPRAGKRLSAAAAAALVLAATLAATPAPPPPPLVRLTVVEPAVEVMAGDTRWQRAIEGASVPLGESLRLGPDAVARLELPWMALTLSSGAHLRFPNALLLSAALESGRALVESEARDSMKLVTSEVEVRGRGRAVVRRRERATLVTCLSGSFRVTSVRGSVALAAGRSCVARAGLPPSEPAAAPAAPGGLWPGDDPVYVGRGEPIELRWSAGAPSYQIELLPVGGEAVLLQRDVGGPPARIEIPWQGAFRWRVSARDAQGIEGSPSREGLIAVE
jgi:hypothetical protein